MNNPYDLYSWSKHYREEALRGAQERHLEGCLRGGGRAHSGRSHAGPAWGGALASLLRWARHAWIAGRTGEGSGEPLQGLGLAHLARKTILD